MGDIQQLTLQAVHLHDLFMSFFWGLAIVLLLLGIILEFFKFPMGGSLQIGQLIWRIVIATILLEEYPHILNIIAEITDSLCAQVGDLSRFKAVLHESGEALKHISWSISNPISIIWIAVVYFAFLILHVTVYFFDAAICFVWILLYVFSPVFIAFFIMPQTSKLTGSLFRGAFEIASWKIIWSVLGTLLWSSSLALLTNVGVHNYSMILVLNCILALSLVFTPIVVRGLTNGAIASVGSKMAALSAALLTAPVLGPTGFAAIAGAPLTGTGKGAKKLLDFSGSKIKSKFFPDKKNDSLKTTPSKTTNGKSVGSQPPAPWPKEPPGWMQAKLDKEKSKSSTVKVTQNVIVKSDPPQNKVEFANQTKPSANPIKEFLPKAFRKEQNPENKINSKQHSLKTSNLKSSPKRNQQPPKTPPPKK